MLHLRKKDKKQDEQVIFIQVAFFAVGAVLLLWYLAPWVLNRILNAGNVLGIAFAVVLLLCGMFAQPVTHLLAPGNHAPGAVVLKAAVALVCAVAVLTSGYMLTGLIQTGHRDETVLVLGCSVKGERPSRMLRQRAGLTASSTPAATDVYLLGTYWMREMLAVVKTVLHI